MPLPIFAVATAAVKGAKAISKTPLFQNAVQAAKVAAGNRLAGNATNVTSFGSSTTLPAAGGSSTSNSTNIMLIAGAAVVALLFFMKK